MARSLPTLAFLLMLQTAGAQSSVPQTAAGSPEQLRRAALARAGEWTSLASSLEARVGKMLPCDRRVRSSIEEVSKASEARIAAEAAYWRAVEEQSRNSLPALDALANREQALSAAWTADPADALQEQSSVDAHVVALKGNLKKSPALVPPEAELEALAANTKSLGEKMSGRSSSAARISADARRSAAAEGALHNAIESKLRTETAEGELWNEYYAARLARADTECSIIGTAAAPEPAVPLRRKPAPGNKQ